MKKLINDVHQVVRESLEGFALAHADLVDVHLDPDFVTRHHPKADGLVGIVSGGGSGHEPLHAGFVGEGMLDAAVPGPVFTSPTPDPILEATRASDHGAGVLHIVKNYTGDVLNFETAAEMAEMDDIEVTSVVVNDDVAVEDSLYTAGRRGVAGTVLVEKIAGAAAERGDDLAGVTAIATRVNDEVRSMGLALGPCTVPHAGTPSFELGDDEIELGIGIHGEPGYRRGRMESADVLTKELYERVRDDLGLATGERVVTLVNGMGGTPLSELYIVHRALAALLDADGVTIERSLVGNYVTSLEMPGASVTLLRVDDELLSLFDAPANTPAWK
ncbi:MAG: dihydroxyacetone kinase subunit DhaK [Actinomyces sp.]|jgi:dihydroxyacetone kinase-like protein|nr:dihydroxyacetone kinase subunit DhaK [Actinomyces sp.]MCI1641951.1 dihydroxyacetone kinase subunit DhaK [Actinomyces sp.]MCI1661964.1 dihydroxyacetone kinase subunit DhaK [Actinomyces sp.]MCI1691157.1 dihydroxyacetone kinase subunit DhaK [Actinomyces sp.]MCI1787767.1 dihydroxyacetone kinase subunit DhaK [Actinomyces sp.]MCI1830326.1 dihydroxyacetone kinase subunit DhaK [Actinomyces sp.]